MNFDQTVEAIIKEAMERGDFDDLPGKGKPIDLSTYFDTPEEVRMAYSVLKNAGMARRLRPLGSAPPAGTSQREIGFTNPPWPAILAGVEVDFLGAEAPFV